MYARGVRTFVEVGAGSVLTELVGRILGDRPHRAMSLDRKGKHGVTTLQEGLGAWRSRACSWTSRRCGRTTSPRRTSPRRSRR